MPAASELPEFLAAVVAAGDVHHAHAIGLAWIADAVDADFVALVAGGELVAQVGEPTAATQSLDQTSLARTSSDPIDESFDGVWYLSLSGRGASARQTDHGDAPEPLLAIGRSAPLTGVETGRVVALGRTLQATAELFARLHRAEQAIGDQRELLETTAFQDHLTGLPNRARFHERCDHALERAADTGTTTGLLFVDLDGFKLVNDTLGHAAGDALLRRVGHALRQGGRSSDTVARIGGDEFAVLLENTSADAAAAAASRILTRIGEVVAAGGFRVQPGASVGVALAGADCRTTDELLRRADIAMYAVKTSGGGDIAFWNPSMSQTRLSHDALAQALEVALANNHLLVHYQPIVDLRSRTISGVEALVRWNDPERGLQAPNTFIDAAEQTGMIIPVGRRVLELACAQVAAWRRAIPSARDLTLSVNLSVRQLEHEQLHLDVEDILHLTELDTDALVLEVTESIFVNDATNAADRLHGLKRLGIRLAIDDFGTGFSSLGYIHNYPFDILKIDRSFVAGIGSSTNSGAIVRTMLALSQQLSMTTVAEGIESQAELAQLRALRCAYGQGFLFAKPMPADDLQHLLVDGNGALTATRS